MGSLWPKICTKFFEMKDMRILLVGLDAAGKTTILYKHKIGEVVTTIPTIWFNFEIIEYKNITFTMYWILEVNKKLNYNGDTIIRILKELFML